MTVDIQKVDEDISRKRSACFTEKTTTKEPSTNSIIYYCKLMLWRNECQTIIINTESIFVLSTTQFTLRANTIFLSVIIR